MQVQKIQNNTSFNGLLFNRVNQSRRQEQKVMNTIREAAKRRHPNDRSTFIKDKWNNFLKERVVANNESRGIDMKNVLIESSHDIKMNRRR